MNKSKFCKFLFLFISINYFSFGQNLDFVKKESLKEKIKIFQKFVKKSPTIHDNYFGETIFLLSNGYNAFAFSLITKIGVAPGTLDNTRCYKLNNNLVWVIDEIHKIDDSIIDKKRLDKISNCNDLLPSEKKQKRIPEMINATFSYEFNERGDYFLDRLNTFDKLLFLNLEFENK